MSSPHQETCTNGDVRMLTLYLHLLLNTVEVLDAYLVRCDLSEAGGLYLHNGAQTRDKGLVWRRKFDFFPLH